MNRYPINLLGEIRYRGATKRDQVAQVGNLLRRDDHGKLLRVYICGERGDRSYVSYNIDPKQSPRFAGINVDPSQRGSALTDILMETGESVLETLDRPLDSRTSRIRKPQIASFLEKWGYRPEGKGHRLQIQRYTTERIPVVRSESFLPGQTSRFKDDWYIIEGTGFINDPRLREVTINTEFKLTDPPAKEAKLRRARANIICLGLSKDALEKLRNGIANP